MWSKTLTPEFADSYFSELIRLIAQQLGIAEWEWKSAREILEELNMNFPKTHAALLRFFEVYRNWIAALNKSGVMREELNEKMTTRDEYRAALIQAVKNRN